MAELVGMLAAGALEVAAGKMAEAASDRIMLQWRLGEDLEYMQRTMESIQAVLKNAERMSPEDEPTQLWLQRLTDASYKISDMFDEFEVNKTRKSTLRKLKILNPCLTLASEVPMASKLKKARETLDKISNDNHKYNSMTTSSSSSNQQAMSERVTSSEVIEAEIVGRDQEKQKIMDLVRASTSSDFVVLPIYGIGGIGKTTLAQLLFNDNFFKDFEKVWVYVSQIFDLKRIKETVTSQLPLNQGQLANKQEQEAGGPARKSILIVLDDLWEENDFKLDDMKNFLKIVGNGHKLYAIVTTRDASIAKKVQTIEAHKIHALSDDVCWDIVKQNAGFEQKAAKERFEVIGKEIAKKCGGVALAARAIGYILRSKDFHEWVSVKDSGIWKESSQGSSSPYDNVLASLKLSYTRMPQDLRPCFAYCAIFPKGHKMAKDELIYQWAALGFIKPSDEFQFPTWQRGEDHIKQLLAMSFLSKSQSTHWRERYKPDNFFTMHDLVHDLARLIMADEVLDASEKSKSGGSKCRYMLLADSSKPLNSFVMHPDKIRALRFLGSGGIGCCHAGFSTAKYLRIMDLGESSLNKLPSFIGHLRLLRYLNASGITDQEIPRCLTKLSKLIYLNLSRSPNLSELPELIGEMESLMYLDLSRCKKIKMLPATFGKLQNLIHLDLCYCYELKVTPEALCSLTKLQYLNLSNCSNLTKEPLEVIGKLAELRYLNLSDCLDTIGHLEGGICNLFDKISALSNLEHLDLSANISLDILPDSLCSLRKLHTLNLSFCWGLKKLPENMKHMDDLMLLINNNCSNRLDTSALVANKNVILLPDFMVHAAEGERSSNLIRLKDMNPHELKIYCLQNAKSVEEGRRIGLRGKESLEHLTLHWTMGTKGFVEDMDLLRELVPPSSLKIFEVWGYNNVSFPPWLERIDIYLPNLVKVSLRDLSWCSNLPPFGQLPYLKSLTLQAIPNITKIDKSLCGDYTEKTFTRLEYLEIMDMENFEEWTTTYSCGEGCEDEFMFPNLARLDIRWCPKLRVSPCPPRVRKSWLIDCSDGVLSQWGECAPHHAICPTSTALVRTLKVRSRTEPMHKWKLLHYLHGLHELQIYSCNDLSLSSSPEITEVLANLQSLYFSGIVIEILPQWISDCVSLKKLEISMCEWTSFPENIQLNHLESLGIFGCPALREWIELEENKTRIAHIREIMLDLEPYHPGH